MTLNDRINRTLVNTFHAITNGRIEHPDALKPSPKSVISKIGILLFLFLFLHPSILFAQVANQTDSLVNVNDSTISLLQKDSAVTLLQEVAITGTNITHYNDKDVVRITKDMRKGSFTTGQMLGKIPGVIYNRQTKSLSYYGQENVMLLVDSLEKSADYIKDLHHMRFEKVDIIPYPKGKYEGYAAVINLHTKKNYEGYEGNVSVNSEFFPESRNVKGDLFNMAKWKESFTYTRNKWNVVLNYNGYFDQTEQNNLSVIQYPLNNYKESVIDNPDGKKNYKSFERTHSVFSSIDYQFDKRNSISVAYRLDLQAADQYKNRTVLQSDMQEERIDTIGSDYVYYGSGYRHTFGLYYRGGFKKWNYTADANFVIDNWDSKNRLKKTSGYTNEDNRKNKMHHTLARTEVNRNFLNNKLYAAFGYNFFWKNYTQNHLETDVELTDYTLQQNQFWTYVSYNFTNSTSLNASGSLIFNKTKNTNVEDNYLSYSGGLGFFQRIKKKDWLRINYNCNVYNPNLDQVTSYGQFTDSLQWNGGNPNLRSAINHHMSIRYHFLNLFTANVRYGYQPRTFSDITEMREGYLENGSWSKYAATTAQNAKHSNLWIGLYYEQRIKHLTLSANVGYCYAKGKYRIYEHSVGYWTGTCRVAYYFEKLGMYASCAYDLTNDYKVWAQGMDKINMDMIWIFLEKTFFKDKLNIQVSYVVPIHFTSGDNTSKFETPIKNAYSQNYNYNKLSSNNFSLSISYRFNGGKSVRQYKREMSEER